MMVYSIAAGEENSRSTRQNWKRDFEDIGALMRDLPGSCRSTWREHVVIAHLGASYLSGSFASEIAFQSAMPWSTISVLPHFLHSYSRNSRPVKVVFSICSMSPPQFEQIMPAIHRDYSFLRKFMLGKS